MPGVNRDGRDAHLPGLAMSLFNLAHRLRELGRLTEALAAAQEAARLFRQSQRIHGDVYTDEVSYAERLATALADLAVEADDPAEPSHP